jgi:hypothetical protein
MLSAAMTQRVLSQDGEKIPPLLGAVLLEPSISPFKEHPARSDKYGFQMTIHSKLLLGVDNLL